MPNKAATGRAAGAARRAGGARDLQKVITALTSPVRREILALIWDREVPAGEIAAAFDVTKPTISQHLAVLREAGLVTATAAGTSRRYQTRQEVLRGLHAALGDSGKWVNADDAPERALADAHTAPVVVAGAELGSDQATTYTAMTDGGAFSRWLGVPVTIRGRRMACTLEWGTHVRGTFEVLHPPELIVMRWDFEDEAVPVPGGELTAYIRVHPRAGGGSRVEVHQVVDTAKQAEFMEGAWTLVLGRLKAGMAAARGDPPARRPRRRKRQSLS